MSRKKNENEVKQNKQDLDGELNILSDSEIVRMAHEGSSSAYEFLIAKYRGLAKSIARRYYISGADNEDVIQEGMIGIFKAVRDYNEELGSSFYSFANLCIERQIQTAVKGANREKHKILTESVSLDSADDDDEQAPYGEPARRKTLEVPVDEAYDPESVAVMRDTLAQIESLSKRVLSTMESKVFAGMLQGKSYVDIAKELHKTPKSIDNAIQRIKKKLQSPKKL